MRAAALAACVSPAGAAAGQRDAAPKPHITFFLVDDWGWGAASWHNAEAKSGGRAEVVTPYMEAVLKDGIELDRHYVSPTCSPTRCAVQSGRNPIHVNVQNIGATYHNPSDPVSGFSAIPRNMTGMAEHLRDAGYVTVAIGKWDAGMATHDHTPQGRGYQHSLIYFHHFNKYWSYESDASKCQLETDSVLPQWNVSAKPSKMVDLWNDDGPAKARWDEGTAGGSCEVEKDKPWSTDDAKCTYEDALFEEKVMKYVTAHDPAASPLFLFWAPHNVHDPAEVPKADYEAMGFITDACGAGAETRQNYLARVRYVDASFGRVIDLFKSKGMWKDMLLVMSSDNGGPIGSASNWPLRGGKQSNLDGGVRVNAFVGGGFLPASVRGSRLGALITVWDWYATFAALAGADPTDKRAKRAGLPPIDGVDQWPVLSGTGPAPRSEVPLGSCAGAAAGTDATCKAAGHLDTIVSGLVSNSSGGLWKLLVGSVKFGGWQGPQYPNVTGTPTKPPPLICGFPPDAGDGCLFDLLKDPTEHTNLAANPKYAQLRDDLLARLRTHNKTTFSPRRGTDQVSKGACDKARNDYGGFWGPWVP